MPAPPLRDRRILILRARTQASALANALAALGATPIAIPVLELAPPTTFAALDAALHALHTFDLLLATSANAVSAFAERARTLALPLTPPPLCAAIGPATAQALATALALPPESILAPPVAVAEALADTLLPIVHSLRQQQGSARLLLVRAEQARDVLPARLQAAGAGLTIAPAYRNTLPAASATLLAHLFASPPAWPHAIPFTSSSSVTHLVALLDEAGLTLPPAIPRISIGPITSQTLRDHHLPPHAEAAEPTIPALLEAIRHALRHPRGVA